MCFLSVKLISFAIEGLVVTLAAIAMPLSFVHYSRYGNAHLFRKQYIYKYIINIMDQ